VRDQELVRQETGLSAASRQEFKQQYGVDSMQEICHQLWDAPQIN